MKKLILIFVFSAVNIFPGCSKNAEEIKIKRNELSGQTEVKEDPEKYDEKNNSSQNSSLIKTITSKEIKFHIGDSLNIKGFIADIYLSEKVAYLNFENKFPKSIFSCAIFSGKFEEFGDLSRYKGKNVEISGRISSYKSKPQVILNSKDQIKIIN